MLARAMEPLIAAFHRFKEVKGALQKGLYTDNTATLRSCQVESGSWRMRHIRLRATIVRETLGNDDWKAAHLPGLFTSADAATKAMDRSGWRISCESWTCTRPTWTCVMALQDRQWRQ